MIVDRPVREHHVRLLVREQPAELVIPRRIDDRVRVALRSENRCSPQNRAGAPRFLDARRICLAARLLAAVQVQEHNPMARIRIPRSRSAAPVFGVAGMPSHDNDVHFVIVQRSGVGSRCVAPILPLSRQVPATLHYAGWTAIRMIVLSPLLTATVMMLARSAVKRWDAAWTATGLATVCCTDRHDGILAPARQRRLIERCCPGRHLLP